MAEEDFSTDSWFTIAGSDNDVVLSSRARLARNLANFPFPSKMQEGECERVQSIVFDAFNHIPDSEIYRTSSVENIDPVGIKLLEERGVLEVPHPAKIGLVYRSDGKVSCTVNHIDHVRIASFVSGFDFDRAFVLAHQVDEALQEKVQFAASYDFGYLTARPMSSGSGMRLSVRVHLPSLSLLNRIAAVSKELSSRGISFTSCFGSGSNSAALGFFYQISTNTSSSGTEFDQIADIASEVKKLIAQERLAREDLLKEKETEVKNLVLRALGLSRYSFLLPLRESIELIGSIKLGKELNLLSGIEDSVLHSLLYRLQDGNLTYLMNENTFAFEKDIEANSYKKHERLRAFVLGQALDEIIVNN